MSEDIHQGDGRRGSWKWWVCGLLLLASAINYMDRQTLANAAVRITGEFSLSQEQYGNLELVFGWAFALGSIVFGLAADRVSLRWLYPVVLMLWSAVGFSTGLVQDYTDLLVCRTLLGFFEAGHWPCAIKTTQRLLASRDRSMGNSVLQSGTSIGAIATPLIMSAIMTDQAGSWRLPFQVIGAAGLLWIALWFYLVRKDDLAGLAPVSAAAADPSPTRSFRQVVFTRRFLTLMIVIALINTAWQLLRAWLPKFLQEGRGYLEGDALHFNALFFIATDVGCLGAGALTVWLHRRGFTVGGSRRLTFFGCALLTSLTAVAAFLPRGWLLLVLLLVVGAGALGLFPVYHAYTQELSTEHQGKITGLLGVFAWAFSPAHKYFGRLIDQTGSFDLGIALVGWMPVAAFVALWFLWGPRRPERNAD